MLLPSTTDIVATPWGVLVADDDEDVYAVTRLALKRRTWNGRPFALFHARSTAEVRGLLTAEPRPTLHCAMVDMAMETEDAGVETCVLLRAEYPPTLKLVLRTGQVEDDALREALQHVGIDHFLLKSEVTQRRLFASVSSCLQRFDEDASVRSVDVLATSIAQLLTRPDPTAEELAGLLSDGLRSVEERYTVRLAFLDDLGRADLPDEARTLVAALDRGHTRSLPLMRLHPGADVGLSENALILLGTALGPPSSADVRARRFGLVVNTKEPMSDPGVTSLLHDLTRRLNVWAIGELALRRNGLRSANSG